MSSDYLILSIYHVTKYSLSYITQMGDRNHLVTLSKYMRWKELEKIYEAFECFYLIVFSICFLTLEHTLYVTLKFIL